MPYGPDDVLLVADVGNTNITFGVLTAGRIIAQWRVATQTTRTADEYAALLLPLCAARNIDLSEVRDFAIASVVPAITRQLTAFSTAYCNRTAIVAGRGKAAWTMPIDVPEPDTVGADRLVNAVAAHAKVPGHLIVIDFGTATTFDVIDGHGAYKGGVIAAGPKLTLAALAGNTAQLPHIAIEPPPDQVVVGTDTRSQMQIGIFWGYLAMVEGLVGKLRASIDGPVTVIATGGLAALFDGHTEIFDMVDRDLTLRGLAIIAGYTLHE